MTQDTTRAGHARHRADRPDLVVLSSADVGDGDTTVTDAHARALEMAAHAARRAAEERAAAERAAAERAAEAERAAADRVAAERAAAEAARRAAEAAEQRAEAERAAARLAAEAEQAARHRAALEEAAALRAAAAEGPPVPRPQAGVGRHRAEGPADPVDPVSPATGRADLGRGTAYSASMLLVLAAPLATIGAGYLAWLEPRPFTIGITGGLAVLSAILVSAVRREATRVVVEDGILDIRTAESHHAFDLRRPDLRIEVHGRPRDRRWRTLVHRTGLDPYVIDASMVDPAAFVRVLREHRPDL
jgi:hypothetical protein